MQQISGLALFEKIPILELLSAADSQTPCAAGER